MKIFLTHIGEEAGLAAVLKRWIEDTFSGKCEVFVSSDSDDIVPGDKWLNELDQALTDAGLFLVLCSPRSVRRPWVNFETGCGWIKRVPIIPICHSGQAKGELPLPLSTFQGIESSQSNFAKELLNAIAKQGSISKVPPIDFVQMMKEIRDAEQARITISGTPEPPATASTATATQVIELKVLAELLEHDRPALHVAETLGLHEAVAQFHLDELQMRNMISCHGTWGPDEPGGTYRLEHAGRRVLIEAGLIK